jgi:hypothetical protein
MSNLETKVAVIQNQMDNIETKVDELKDMLTKFIETSDGKFASKWVEDALKWVLYTVAGILVVALLALVIKQ